MRKKCEVTYQKNLEKLSEKSQKTPPNVSAFAGQMAFLESINWSVICSVLTVVQSLLLHLDAHFFKSEAHLESQITSTQLPVEWQVKI